MEWQRPEFLYFILPLCAAWFLLALYSDRLRRRARVAFASQAMWLRIFPEDSRFRFWFKLALRELAIVMGLVALAGPRFGIQYEQVIPRGADLYVLIDVSRSMLADDVPPSRLGRAKADVSSLLNRLQGERVGLIAFAGQAVVKCPLTVDYDSFRRALEELDPDSAPRGGTAIGDAIRKGLEVFHANAERDQAMLLITDGDDQQSYPLEAAAAAKERHVTVFTIGLGDTERGARVPQKSNAKSFLEYNGEQVWSKLDSSLLEQIALTTSGVYIPAGTRAYDLGELYTNHLQGRHGEEVSNQQRIRRSEQFQYFLAFAIAALLIDLCVVPHRRSRKRLEINDESTVRSGSEKRSPNKRFASRGSVPMIVLLIGNFSAAVVEADEPEAMVRDGLRLYSKEQYEEAREKFSAASEELDKRKSAAAAITAFDEACAAQRKHDFDRSRDSYLRAGLSQDRSIAIAAHFNLGSLYADRARELTGDKPELVAPDKRQEVLDQLTQAIAAYRHCLELQSDHASSRRNIELLRQWIKYYSDRWREIDRQKRRDESNLLQFLEFLTQTQSTLRQTVTQLPESIHADALAELKRAQEELQEEIPTLRDKINHDLRPQPDPQSAAQNNDPQELEQGIKLLQSWADTAGEKMSAAAQRLKAKDTIKAAIDQQAAIDELDKIWEGIVPFHPLLAKELTDQSSIAKSLEPDRPKHGQTDDGVEPFSDTEQKPENESTEKSDPKSKGAAFEKPQIANDDLSTLEKQQTRTLRRAQLIGPKAEMELQRLESVPAESQSPSTEKNDESTNEPQRSAVDPEQAKAGYRKAIELAPRAIEQMEAAVNMLQQKNKPNAAERSEEARRILEEIQQAQPKNDQKQDQNKQDQKQNEDKNQSKENKQDEQQKKDEQKSDQKKNEGEDQQKSEQNKSQEQVSQDRMEEVLRKVRERQQEKRERDRKLKGQYLGKMPVDKDW